MYLGWSGTAQPNARELVGPFVGWVGEFRFQIADHVEITSAGCDVRMLLPQNPFDLWILAQILDNSVDKVIVGIPSKKLA